MSTERLFISLALPPAVRTVLATLTQPQSGITWTQPEQLHVTLRFLGDVPVETIEPIITRLGDVQVAPFILPLEGAGSGHPRLFQLRQRIDDALLATGLPIDVRSFIPHVTLARVTERAAATAT